MRFGVPKEANSETRVAMVPDTVKAVIKKGHTVVIQSGAGQTASISDADFTAAGATIVPDFAQLVATCDCLLRIHPLSASDASLIPDGKSLVGFLAPARNPELVQELAKRRITSFAMDAIPRITRAQSMDALSSMATVAGYKAVLLAASHLPKFIPMLTTAAGTIRPSKALILGAGVAGLQAIATARRIGAVVEAYDVRPAAKEQVKSLGATFVEAPVTQDAETQGGYAKEVSADILAQQRKLLHEHVAAADIVVTTAQVPGKPAPRLVTKEMVAAMKAGSVIVDLAAETGGNCELTEPGMIATKHNVTIIGLKNLPATVPLDASRMLARNFTAFILEITNDKGFTFDWSNEIFRDTCITHNGEVNQKRSNP
jgi:H+-translocating NAD(P) transhydrogenase subunit alpha